ncbi:MAG: VOC family protein [Chloroflexi bacterium]|nr:VOC family protein [Chloroflexota bacterium]
MAKLRHIAISTKDAEGTARFYREAFDMEEVGRAGPSDFGFGIYLSDGTINLAILDLTNAKFDQLGKGLDYVGLHHFGVVVEDRAEMRQKLDGMEVPCILEAPEHPAAGEFFEVKFRGPDGVVFDISEHPWVGAAGID